MTARRTARALSLSRAAAHTNTPHAHTSQPRPTKPNQENPMNPPEPRQESLGAAIIELDRTRLPWPARWLLRDGTRARSVLADEVARRVEQRVTPRVWKDAAEQINARWEKALTAQTDAAADLPAFGSVIACPKCLDKVHGRNTRWCEAQIGGTRPEVMRRTCGCGFSWLEAPADAQALSGPQSDETAPGDAVDPEGASEAHSTPRETALAPDSAPVGPGGEA